MLNLPASIMIDSLPKTPENALDAGSTQKPALSKVDGQLL